MGRGLSILSVLISMVVGVVIVIGVMLFFPLIGVSIMDGLRGGETEPDGPALRSAAEIDARVNELQQNADRIFENTQQTQEQPAEENSTPVTLTQPTLRAAPDTAATQGVDAQALEDIRRREERRRAAMEAPLGESLFTVESLRADRQAAADGIAEEREAGRQTGQGSGQRRDQVASEVFADARSVPRTALVSPPQNASGQLLAAGSVIPASLINDIRSDLPGLIRGQVTNDVYDTLTGAQVVIPRGSMLLGSYGDETGRGQQRLFIYWTRLLFPDGTSVDLQKAGGIDADGASGLKGRRRSGFVTALFGGALLNLVQNAGRQDTTSSDLATAARAATQASVGTVADRYLESILSRGPSFAVKAGTILNVQIEQDYYLSGRRPQ